MSEHIPNFNHMISNTDVSGTSQVFELRSFSGGLQVFKVKRRAVDTYQIKCSNSKFYTSLKMKMVLPFDIMWRLYETVQLPENAQDSFTLSVNTTIKYNSVRQ